MSKLVPKLRFDGFSGDWEEKSLKDVTIINMGQSPSSSSYNDIGNGLYLIQGNADIKNRKSNPRQWTTEPTKSCNLGDLILTVRAPVGHIAKSLHIACIGRGVCSIAQKENNSLEFIYQFLLSYEKKWVSLEQGSTFTAVSGSDIKSLKFFIPKPLEQQKIADTLSSLDNLIEATNKKIEALKKHKKALMQQMFPKDGEKVPELRFKGFSGEWEEKILGDIISYFKGFPFESKNYTSNGRRVVRVSDMGFNYIKKKNNAIYINEEEAWKYERWKLQKKDLIITTVGSKPPMYDSLVGRTIIVQYKDEGALLNQNAVCLRANKNIKQHFFNALFNKSEYINFIKSIIRGNANQGSITLENLFQYKMLIPKDKAEQQKIANTLSSLDNLIEATSKKIEALKKHKKGLMQQMFVSSEVKF